MSWTWAFRSLWRNRVRSFVTLLGVASLLFLVSFLVSILTGLAHSTETDTSHLRLITRHQISLTFPLPESYWERIRQVPHVRQVCPTSWYGGKYGDGSGSTFFARFFVDPATFLDVMTDLHLPEDQARDWMADRQGAITSEKLAKKYGWKLGDRITLVGDIYPVTTELNLRGLYTGGEDGFYFQRKYVEEATGNPGQVGTFTIAVDEAASLAPVGKAIDAMFEDGEAPTKTESEKAFQAGFVSMMGNVKGFITRLALVIAVTVLLTAGNTMAMAIRERRTEIAVLKALGFLPGRILRMILCESLLLTGLAGLLGVGGFWLLTWLLFVVAKIEVPMLFFVPTLQLVPGLLLFAGVAVLGIVAGIIPGWMAARRSVVDGLRRA